MAKRVSHSLLDPWLTQPLKGLYGVLHIPSAVPPEAIVIVGHLCAVVGAIGFATSTRWGWGGLIAAFGVAANHIADVLDGTHARSTNQCRNSGELLDHFVDPLSFSYWTAGMGYSVGTAAGPWLAAAGITVIFATAVLTNIRAKMLGEFTLARFGPTEFKTLLVAFGLWQSVQLYVWAGAAALASKAALWFVSLLVALGLIQLLVSLRRAVREVNRHSASPADTTEWKLGP